jgi:hypothetical protein
VVPDGYETVRTSRCEGIVAAGEVLVRVVIQ